MPTDMQAAFAALVGRLTGPGGPSELVTEDVLGIPTQVFKNREASLAQIFENAEAYGDADYLVTEDQRISFAQHARDVRSLALAFSQEHGIGKGDRVAIMGANSPQWVEAFWAVQILGAIAVGFNAWWLPDEIQHSLDDCTPKLLIVDNKRRATLSETAIPVLSMEEDIPRLAAQHPDAASPEVHIDEDDPSTIVYTSGTSGRAKGAVHSHRNVVAVIGYHRFNDQVRNAFAGEGGIPDRRYLLTTPLFHISGLHNLAVPRLATGTAVCVYQGRFEPNRVLALIDRERITDWAAVPTMAKRLADDGDFDKYDTSSMTAFALASAPSSTELQLRLREKIPFTTDALVDSYGLTESSTGVAVATSMDLIAHPGTLGRPTIGVEIEIRDPLGVPLPEGEEGEVCVRTQYVMLGYWNNPAATAAAIDENRWLRTGDLGTMIDGMLYLNSRRSDLILRGGENVYPTEVEQCLDECPGVLECAVLGAPDPDLGQIVVAVVITDESDPITEEALEEWVAQRLAYFKRPVRWRISTEPLRRTATGKVLRNQPILALETI